MAPSPPWARLNCAASRWGHVRRGRWPGEPRVAEPGSGRPVPDQGDAPFTIEGLDGRRSADPGLCGLASGPGCARHRLDGYSQVPLAAKRPAGRWFSRTPALEVDVSHFRWPGLTARAGPTPPAASAHFLVGDEAVIAVGALLRSQLSQLTVRRLRPAGFYDPYRRGRPSAAWIGVSAGLGITIRGSTKVHAVRNRHRGDTSKYRLDADSLLHGLLCCRRW